MRSLVLAALLLFAGCLGSPASEPAATTTSAAATMPAAKDMYIVASDFATPASEGFYKFRCTGDCSFKKDDIVNVTLKNAVGNRDVHNLVLQGYDVKLKGVKDLGISVVFNATKTGTFTYYCDLMYGPGVSHRQAGFEGRITVS